MGVKVGEAYIELTSDDSRLKPQLNRAKGQVTTWAAGLGSVVAAGIGAAGVAGVAAGTAAVLALGGLAVDISNEMDTVQGNLRTQLGLTQEQAEELGDVALDVWANNFGDSIDDVSASIATVRQNMNSMYRPTAEELGLLTEFAIGLRDAFDVDINESTRTANMLMEQFGVTGDEAFTIITAGFQNGLNSSDDLLDTLHEYAADFDDLGFTADQVLSTLNAGLQDGIFNTDKIGDLFREFKINLLDAGRIESIEGISEDVDDLAASFQAGEISGFEAFNALQRAIRGIEDPVDQQAVGVAFLGSLYEDLGKEAVLALDIASDSLTNNYDVLGSLNAQYETLPAFFQGLGREAKASLLPLGDVLLDLANGALPMIRQGFDFFNRIIETLIGLITTGGGLFEDYKPAFEDVSDLFRDEMNPAFDNFKDLIRDDVIPLIQEWVPILVDRLLPPLIELALVTLPHLANAFNWAVNAGRKILPVVELIIDVLSQLIQRSIETQTQVTRDWEEMMTNARILGKFITSVFGADWSGLGRDLIKGIARGIRNQIHGLKQAARDAVKSAMDEAKRFLQIRSPAKLPGREIGEPFVQGIAASLTAGQTDIEAAIQEMMQMPSLDFAGAGAATAGASRGDTNIYFNGAVNPTTPQGAEDAGFMVKNALDSRGEGL